jgi:hypothetical protein
VPESFAHFGIPSLRSGQALSAAKDLFDYRSDADHPTPDADHADPDADGVDPFALVDDSATDVANPSSYHCDPYGFMYESDGLVCESDELVCESDELMCESVDKPSASSAGVSKPVDLVADSFDLVADPFAGLCESDAAVAESVSGGADPGGNVGDSGGDVAASAEDVRMSGELVGLPGERLRDPDDPVAVLFRVHSVTYANVYLSDDLHAVPVAALRTAVEVVSYPDDLLRDRIRNADDAVEAPSGSVGTTSLKFCRIWDMVRPFRAKPVLKAFLWSRLHCECFSSRTRTKPIVYPCARNGTPDASY